MAVRRRPDRGLEPPAHLNPEAAAHWDEVLAALSVDHDLTASDRDLLALYCDYFARWKKARENLEAQGLMVKLSPDSEPRVNPFLEIANQCARELRTLAGDLGLSPASRRRLRELKERAVTQDTISRINVTVPADFRPSGNRTH